MQDVKMADILGTIRRHNCKLKFWNFKLTVRSKILGTCRRASWL